MRPHRVALPVLLLASTLLAAQPSPSPAPASVPVPEALARLKEGVARFEAGKTRHPHSELGWRSTLKHTQHPFATIVGCSDSRVPPELIFDQGFGDLFTVRVAGNVMTTDVVGSLEYAYYHLGTRLVVIMGHEGCGAVTAAVDARAGRHTEPAAIETLIGLISPALEKLDRHQERNQLISRAVETNVRWACAQLESRPRIKALVSQGKLELVRAVYEVETGRVRWLE
jgi:carbonic anhydrase